MLKFSEIFEFSSRTNPKIPILKEFEWFEWFGPSPIEPFNSALDRVLREQLGGGRSALRELLLQLRPPAGSASVVPGVHRLERVDVDVGVDQTYVGIPVLALRG